MKKFIVIVMLMIWTAQADIAGRILIIESRGASPSVSLSSGNLWKKAETGNLLGSRFMLKTGKDDYLHVIDADGWLELTLEKETLLQVNRDSAGNSRIFLEYGTLKIKASGIRCELRTPQTGFQGDSFSAEITSDPALLSLIIREGYLRYLQAGNGLWKTAGHGSRLYLKNGEWQISGDSVTVRKEEQ